MYTVAGAYQFDGFLTVVNFSERSCEKKADPFARAISARACTNCIALTELTQVGKPKC